MNSHRCSAGAGGLLPLCLCVCRLQGSTRHRQGEGVLHPQPIPWPRAAGIPALGFQLPKDFPSSVGRTPKRGTPDPASRERPVMPQSNEKTRPLSSPVRNWSPSTKTSAESPLSGDPSCGWPSPVPVVNWKTNPGTGTIFLYPSLPLGGIPSAGWALYVTIAPWRSGQGGQAVIWRLQVYLGVRFPKWVPRCC